jgi:aldehyde:ferredoxin oxidoreductase
MTDIASLKKSIDDLNNTIKSFMSLFSKAGEELKKEPADDEKINSLMQKISSLEEQNEKIARGIVAVADMLKEKERRPKYPSSGYNSNNSRPTIKPSMPSSQNMQQQQTGAPKNVQAPPVKPLPSQDKKEERKGFLDMFKK